MSRLVMLALCALAAMACDDSMSPDRRILALEFIGLEPLANGFHYEGWAITAAGPVSTGKFNVGSAGGLVTPSGGVIAGGEFASSVDLAAATAIVITIEPSGDVDAVPAATKILAGPISNGTAALSAGAAEAVGSNFAGAAGEFILATPTDGMNTNETSGIWFLKMVSGSPVAGLTLPTLPSGWRYEGWAVIAGTPVTTGTFTSVTGADAAAPFSGPQPGPPFPGEDFLMNPPTGLSFPTNLAGATSVITVEPSPDDSPAPFTLKPLLGVIPSDATSGVAYSMGLNTSTFPVGVATVR